MSAQPDHATPDVTVVIPALNEGENLVDTVRVVHDHSGELCTEIVVVDDGSVDGAPQRVAAQFRDDPSVRVVHGPRTGIATARNAGAALAAAPFIVFLDGHCYVPPGWLSALIAPFEDPAVGLSGPMFVSIRDPTTYACGVTWADAGLDNVWLPHDVTGPVPFHIGACQAVRADVFADVGGFDAGMTRWGSEDIELCLRMWLMGHEVHAAPKSVVHHLFRTSRPYDVDMSLIVYNQLRMAVLHFDERRLAAVLQRMVPYDGVERALAMAFANGIVHERDELLAARTHDVDWLFDRFGIEF